MIMTIKLDTALKLNVVLKSIIDNTDLKIDPLFKFKLLGIMKNLEIPISNFEAIRNEKIREYGKEDKDGNFSILKEDVENMEKFVKDIDALVDSDVEVNIQALKVTDVFNKGLPADYLVGLYPIIEEQIMYSWQINQILERNNFVICEEDYKDISNPIENPQIINVRYDTFNDSFRISTKDGYLWDFKVRKYN